MQNILNKIKGIYPLSTAQLNQLLGIMQRVEIRKNRLIIRAGRTEKSIYFIEKGIARAFCESADSQITFWFGMEGDLVLSYNSYINDQPGYESVELLENSVLYEIKTAALEVLFKEDAAFANWGRKLAELELIKSEECLIGRLFKTATERYSELLRDNPALVQRIQLGYIASYLGVTQVTLSRIRSEIK
ncbi:Crp/Fnr family transcriptional regulator [Pedobacter africanus]|uniref:cAMP-binding domain of CRP or a regulatory subunit of cAMP-dependent protein kinases n=1 Tax=Pedobacter africanus TaxID=151894 RepID=A0A1W2B878_9SPHI|nr:Crp/Fnr family transcriptional regulator [Pedobacter africanus]SMC69185.1 cAMP-binding domain of CRP or a regulatory subunit of cAMP-dependent protein kinases [Pedobacter africanus]